MVILHCDSTLSRNLSPYFYMKVLMFTAPQTFMLCCVRWPDMAVIPYILILAQKNKNLIGWVAGFPR